MRNTSGLDNAHKWIIVILNSGVAVEDPREDRIDSLALCMARPCDIEMLGEYSFIIAARNSTSAQEPTVIMSYGLQYASI